MKKVLLVFGIAGSLFIQLSSSAQTLKTILGNSTKNLLSTGVTDNTILKVSNTGTVPLRMCTSPTATGQCLANKPGVTIAASQTMGVTVGQIGGIALGTNINITNSQLLPGTITFTTTTTGSTTTGGGTTDPQGPGTTGGNPICLTCLSFFNCLTAAPAVNAWEHSDPLGINGSDTIGLCPGMYQAVNIKGNGTLLTDGIKTSTISTGDLSANNVYTGVLKATDVEGASGYFSGSVGIGTSKYTDGSTNYALSVNGNVRATHIRVYSGWADYVFQKDYKLRSISELEQYISENGHLPEIPSAKDVEKGGVDLGDMVQKQMAKIEELTRYIIDQQKEIDTLKKQVNNK